MKSKQSPKLTARKLKFCEQYLLMFNATKAAEMAGYSSKTARSIGQRLLTNVDIQNKIAELQAETREKTEITKQAIIDELSAIAFADIRDYLWFDGFTVRFKPFSELTPRQAKAIESVKQTKAGIELKLHGKSWSIDRVCKLFGYNAPKDLNIMLDKMDEEAIDQVINRFILKND